MYLVCFVGVGFGGAGLGWAGLGRIELALIFLGLILIGLLIARFYTSANGRAREKKRGCLAAFVCFWYLGFDPRARTEPTMR